MFWGDSAHEGWFQGLVETGTYAGIAYGEYLPAVPMFCAEPSTCASGSFQPAAHPFKGQVIALVNANCVSSCDGFLWALHRTLGNRVRLVGQPAAADSAWARAVIDVVPQIGSSDSTTSVRTLFDAPRPGRLTSQSLILSRAVTAEGSLLNGRPDAVDRFVPLTIANRDAWPQTALQAAFDLVDQK